ncbi:unnamed protein product [Gadus morhua 'NCC']
MVVAVDNTPLKSKSRSPLVAADCSALGRGPRLSGRAVAARAAFSDGHGRRRGTSPTPVPVKRGSPGGGNVVLVVLVVLVRKEATIKAQSVAAADHRLLRADTKLCGSMAGTGPVVPEHYITIEQPHYRTALVASPCQRGLPGEADSQGRGWTGYRGQESSKRGQGLGALAPGPPGYGWKPSAQVGERALSLTPKQPSTSRSLERCLSSVLRPPSSVPVLSQQGGRPGESPRCSGSCVGAAAQHSGPQRRRKSHCCGAIDRVLGPAVAETKRRSLVSFTRRFKAAFNLWLGPPNPVL